jgi:hypothetical protein
MEALSPDKPPLCNIRLLDFQFQANHEHASRGIQGILAVGGVDAAVHLVKDVVNTDTRLQIQVLQAIKRVPGIDVPDAVITCALDGVDSEVLEGWIGVKVCREMIRHLEEAICHYEDLYKD